MTEMREFYANVYADGKEDHPEGVAYVFSEHYGTRSEADELCDHDSRIGRVHVRLKPDGAPKRYASEANRRAWETNPDRARSIVACGNKPERVWFGFP